LLAPWLAPLSCACLLRRWPNCRTARSPSALRIIKPQVVKLPSNPLSALPRSVRTRRLEIQRGQVVMNRRSLLVFAAALAACGLAGPSWAQGERKPFTPQELDQILAPIALYDDSLLAQGLIA